MSTSAPTNAAPDTRPPTPPSRRGGSVLARALETIGAQNLSLVAAIILLAAFIAWQNPNFLLPGNLRTIGMAVTISGLLAVVQTVMIILGGIDISVGSIAGLASVSSAMIYMATQSAAIAVVGALVIGSACGLFNALVVVFGRVTPMIATLAGLATFKGVAQLVSDGRAQGYTGADPFFKLLSRGSFIGIPTLVWVLVVVAVLVHVMLTYTTVGRNIYAIGGNDRAARLAGININRHIIGAFILVGAVAALAGLLITARTGSGQPVSGSEGLEFASITAAALGGVALRGGKGSIGGTILAVILLGILLNGMTLLGVNPFWQNVAQGTLLVAAVIIQQLRSGERRVGLPK